MRLRFDPRKYSSHSIRRAQVRDDLIKIQGDWSSDGYFKYIECNTEQRMQVARDMVKKIREMKVE